MKTFYTNSIHTLLVVFTLVLLASSCSKKSEPDPLDQYTGTWTTNAGDGMTISKSGTALVLTDFTPNGSFTASVSGSGFQADNKNIATGVPYRHPDNSQAQLYVQNLTGIVSGNKLTLTFTLFSQSATMYYREGITEVFTKK